MPPKSCTKNIKKTAVKKTAVKKKPAAKKPVAKKPVAKKPLLTAAKLQQKAAGYLLAAANAASRR